MEDHTELVQSKRATPDTNVLKQDIKLKLCISYSHQDNSTERPYIEEFKKHIAPLKNNGQIEEWYDRLILPGEDLYKEIDQNFEDADIVCLFISADFLLSRNCMSEKKKALKLRTEKGIRVIPIILSPCGWQDDAEISNLRALPIDGQPVSGFKDRNVAWQEIYNGLKEIIAEELKIRQLNLTEKFKFFLHDTEMLTKAHSKKESVSLDDIYIPTELSKYDSLKEYKETISSDELVDHLFADGKIIIAGENQSGKTTLCKRLFCELRSRHFIPIYVSDQSDSFLSKGKIKNVLSKMLYEQYGDINEAELDVERIVPIIDDFHRAKNKEKHVRHLSNYPHCIVVVDDIFSLNIEDEALISSFTTFRIKELKPSLINKLVKKWVGLTDKDGICDYKEIDKNTEFINTTLGKGLMPAYPFFILSTIVTYEAFTLSLDQDITSQGYCYQAFLYFYLRKRGVRNDEIDIYMNFLKELAFYMYEIRHEELSPDRFSTFTTIYSDKYNLPIELEVVLTNLSEVLSYNSVGNYSFRYPCFYYFFVAKALSEHLGDTKVIERIEDILNNLHVDENAYIAVFLTHHSNNVDIFEKIEDIASTLFDRYNPASLTKDEMKFFDEQVHNIVNAVLPPANVTPEMERAERLKIQDEFEQSHENEVRDERIDENDTFTKDLRKAIKTVEVIGCIIRNRAGSEKVRLRKMFLSGMNVHLRMLSSFFEQIKSESRQKEMVDLISNKLNRLDEGKDVYKMLDEEEKRRFAKIILWNLNFLILYGIIYKIIHSLGSDKLIKIINSVCDEIDNPASSLIKHGILMDYDKSLEIKDFAIRVNGNDFSEIAKRAARFMIVDYCSSHNVHYRDKQRIVSHFKIDQKKLSSKGS